MTIQATNKISIQNESPVAIPVTRQDSEKIVKLIEQKEQCRFGLVEIVYVDEDEILRINRQYLHCDYITDIITFGYNEPQSNDPYEATLFCCAPRIDEQAREYQIDLRSEFLRVLIHGLLHITGYGDRDDEQKAAMRARENFYLNLF